MSFSCEPIEDECAAVTQVIKRMLLLKEGLHVFGQAQTPGDAQEVSLKGTSQGTNCSPSLPLRMVQVSSCSSNNSKQSRTVVSNNQTRCDGLRN